MSNEYKVDVLAELHNLGSVQRTWETLPLDPNADPDFYLAVLKTDERMKPHVITLKEDNVVTSILLGRTEKKSLEIHFGYKKIAIPGVRFLTLVHGGELGSDSEQSALRLVDSVQKTLRNGHADVAHFHAIDKESALYRIVAKAGGLLTRDYYPEAIQRWRLRLPNTFDELLRRRSTNTRHNLKRYAKRLRESFDGELSIRCFRSPGELATLLRDTETVASKTYHRGLGVGFVDDPLTRELMSLSASKGWLRAYILYLRGTPAAFWNGFLYRRTFFTWTTGYDPGLSELRPGSYLLQQLLAGLCEEGTVDEVDFGFGDAQYKQDWSDYCRRQVSQLLFAPTVKGVFLNCVRTPLVGTSGVARKALAHTTALQRFKKWWRKRLATKQTIKVRPSVIQGNRT